MPRESKSDRRERAEKIVAALRKARPETRTELEYSSPLELLVAVILSAQCTDAKVNEVTAELFKVCRTPEDFAAIDPPKLERMIKSTGFFRNKTKSVRGMAQALLARHDGKAPRTMAELVALPGVARKTANVVLWNAFGVSEGVAVDTHVIRLAGRLKLSTHEKPEKIEKDLMELIPRDEWGFFANALVLHGRYVCTARKPDCAGCRISDLCPSAFTFEKK